MVLDRSSSRQAHALQNISLISLSILFLPLNLFILASSYVLRGFFARGGGRRRPPAREAEEVLIRKNSPPSSSSTVKKTHTRQTLLVTGVGMTKGLTLARSFHLAGHRVIGADFEPHGIPSPGRFSAALDAFYRLPKPSGGTQQKASSGGAYIQGLVDVILREKVDIWVSCSGVASAVEDGEAMEIVHEKTHCRAVQFNVVDTRTLHEKHTFIQRTAGLGLNVPETKTVTSRGEVAEVLKSAPRGRTYLVKTIGVDDVHRGGVLLPKTDEHETSQSLAQLEISKRNPWIMQQFVRGEEFCTHALVVRGKVKAFVACPSSELLMHYTALPSTSALSRAMLRFTDRYAAGSGEGFTGHLSFDFLVEDTTPEIPERIVLFPIECNPRAHTAVCLFNGTSEMVDGYLDLVDEQSDDEIKPIATPTESFRYYWVGHDLVEFVLIPLTSLVRGRLSFSDFSKQFMAFVVHLMSWRDGTYEVWDPLPWFALYHVYWPLQFLYCLRNGKKWSRVNVSTLKMFEC